MTVASDGWCARWGRVVGMAAALGAVGAPVEGEPRGGVQGMIGGAEVVTVPQPPRRTVVVFDFDEADNPDPVPPHWRRAQDNPATGFSRPGFPAHNAAELDREVKRSGLASVRVSTRGGSAGLRLEAGQVPVFADADYIVQGYVRTTELKHARAFLRARLLDQQLREVEGAEVRSAPVLSPGLWTPVSITMPGKFSSAAWLQVDLEVLQPRQFEAAPAGALAAHTVWREDVSGAAWFDDVGVYQIPRARVMTGAPENIITAPARPVLTMLVRDLAGQMLEASVRVTDVDGRVVARNDMRLDPGARPVTWDPALPGFGWYHAEMDVAAAGTPVSRSEVAFLYQSAPRAERGGGVGDAGSGDRWRFGIIAEALPEQRLFDLVRVIDQIGTGFIYLPAFDAGASLEEISGLTAARGPLYGALLERRQEVTLSVPRAPRALAKEMSIDGDDVVAMAERGNDSWVGYLSPTLDVYGQRLQRYQVGAVGDEHAEKRSAGRGVSAFEAAVARLVPAPMISVPWGAERAPGKFVRVEGAAAGKAGGTASPRETPGPLVDGVTLTYPLGFPAEGMGSVAREWSGVSMDAAFPGTPVEVTVVPELPGAERYGRRASVIEIMKRAVYFWGAFAGEGEGGGRRGEGRPARFGVRSPWRLAGEGDADGGPQDVWPEPELGVMRVLAERLGGRRVVGPMPAPPGVKAFILAGVDPARRTLDRGCVVAWNETAAPGEARLDLAAAGAELTIVDPFGNERVVSAGAGESLVGVTPGPTPEFIEGVDPYLALFASSLRLEPSFVPAVVAEHEHRLTLTNPWPVRISGQLQIKEAVTDGSQGREWNISPRGLVEFVAAPGEAVSIPVTMSFSAGQLAGAKDFLVLAKVLADRQYPPVRLKATVTVGLPTLDLRPELQLGPGPEGPDVYVVAAVTNKDARARTLRLEAAAPGLAVQQLQVSDLPAGQTIYRRFVFKGVAGKLTGRRIVVSLSDPEAAERLNRAVVVP